MVDGLSLVTTGGRKLKVSEVMTGIGRTFHEDLQWITSIDISVDNTLLAAVSTDRTMRV